MQEVPHQGFQIFECNESAALPLPLTVGGGGSLDSRSPFALPMSCLFTADAFRRTTLLAVMAALLLAQTLGLVHRVVHAPQSLHAASGTLAASLPAAVQAARTGIAEAGMASPHWWVRLFALHDGKACDAYDQRAHADFLWSHPPELCTQAVNHATRTAIPARQFAAQAVGYLARGPPALA